MTVMEIIESNILAYAYIIGEGSGLRCESVYYKAIIKERRIGNEHNR